MMEEHPDLETLSACVERELAGARHAKVEEHLARCASCRASISRIEALVGEAAALPREIEAPDAAWDGIRARLARAPRPRRWERMAALASLAAAAAVVLAVGMTLRPGRSEKVTASPGAPAVGPATVSVVAIDRSYASPIAELRASLEQQRAQLSPATIRVLERTLAVIDTAIAEARAALAADPGNRMLTDILSAQYEQKVGLLQRATKLSPST